VTFVTLEDETGTINVVVWRTTAEKYRRALLGATLLTVTGHVERVETSAVPVVHLIAARLSDQSQLLVISRWRAGIFIDAESDRYMAATTEAIKMP